jgi:hypothetical protein
VRCTGLCLLRAKNICSGPNPKNPLAVARSPVCIIECDAVHVWQLFLHITLIVKLGSLPMRSDKILELLSHVYDNVALALWAIGFACIIYLGAFVIPRIPTLREQYQRARAREIADENALYCNKLNMNVGTQAYNECLLVLGDFRLKVEQRISSENDDF